VVADIARDRRDRKGNKSLPRIYADDRGSKSKNLYRRGRKGRGGRQGIQRWIPEIEKGNCLLRIYPEDAEEFGDRVEQLWWMDRRMKLQ